jgi:hypothetical protein
MRRFNLAEERPARSGPHHARIDRGRSQRVIVQAVEEWHGGEQPRFWRGHSS